jgi:hypothetical protein
MLVNRTNKFNMKRNGSQTLMTSHCEPSGRNLLIDLGIACHAHAHLHCNTPALAGGARERSAAQVSQSSQQSFLAMMYNLKYGKL